MEGPEEQRSISTGALIRQRPREAALVGAAALILLFLTMFSFSLSQKAIRDAQTADQLTKFNGQLTELVQVLRTLESSQRGYLLTDDSSYLEPYDDRAGEMLPLASELQTQAPSGLPASQQIARIIPLLKSKLDEMRETIALSNAGRRSDAIARVKNGKGLELTESVETVVKDIQSEGAALVHANELSTSRLQTIKLFIDGVGAVLIISFSFLSLILLLRSNAAIKTAQDALSKANAELEDTVAQRTGALKRANEEIQRFAYIVSHDLRSPLVNIMGFTSELETLRKELFQKLQKAGELAGTEGLNADFDEAFGFIKSSISRMDRLIAAILQISREGNRPLNEGRIDMNALVENLSAGIAHQIREKDALVEIGQLPPLNADRLAIEQIFSNLIENALKFLKPSEQGRIRIDGQTKGGGGVEFTISDNGRGIDPKDHSRIFELFRRSGPQDVPGEGMGLAYVTTLIRRLGGTITVESQLGQGSTFKLVFPKAVSKEKKKAA